MQKSLVVDTDCVVLCLHSVTSSPRDRPDNALKHPTDSVIARRVEDRLGPRYRCLSVAAASSVVSEPSAVVGGLCVGKGVI